MFDAMQLFIGTAMAQEAVPPALPTAPGAPVAPAAGPVAGILGGQNGEAIMRYLPVFLILIVFYFLLIRPQQKKIDEQTAMLKALKKGDQIVTQGGLVGKIVALEGEGYLMVELAPGMQVKVVRATVTGLAPDDKADKKADKK